MALDIAELRRKADAGSAVAQTQLGICLLDGIDLKADYQEAFRLLSSAAKKGSSRSIVNLARIYEEGLGVEKNMLEAIRLYKDVSNVEFLASVSLGRIYSRGKGVAPDAAEAVRYYSLAAEWGNRIADCPEMHEAKEFVGRHSR